MTGSYSEILSPSRLKNSKSTEEEPVDPSLQKLSTEGTVLKDGEMVHFIAKNLETKIRLSSPDISGSYFISMNNISALNCYINSKIESNILGANSDMPMTESSPTLDSTFLNLLEREARCIAASVDALTEHLGVSLHTVRVSANI